MDIITNILREMWAVLGEMSIYLLFGFLVAGILSVLISPQTVERHLGGKGIWPVIKATLFGVPLPLCSCGVIPVATSIRKHGATRGATTSFLMSTPQTGVDSILVTYSLLGGIFAIFRPVVAVITGIIGGALVDFFDHRRPDKTSELPKCDGDCCSLERPKRGKLYRAVHHGFVVLPEDIGLNLLVGLLVAGLIAVFVPPDFFAGTFLAGGIGAMVVMMLIGIPTYVCASASVPMAMALLAKGVSPGAALVFLITGPASNAATIATIWKIMGRRTTVLYLLTTAVTAIGAGFALDAIFTFAHVSITQQIAGQEMLPEMFKSLSSIVLLGVLIGPKTWQWWQARRHIALDREAKAVILNIAGIHCCECAESVENAILSCNGVSQAKVHLQTGKAVVYGDNIDLDCLHRTIRELGLTVSVDESGKSGAECTCDHH
jgi:hypothetical protein